MPQPLNCKETGGFDSPREPTIDFPSLVKYGPTYEVPAEAVVFGEEMYKVFNVNAPPVIFVKFDPDCPPVEIKKERRRFGVTCIKRNKDGTVSREEMQNTLDSILPPKEYDRDGRKWRTPVSNMPGIKEDIILLQERLDMYLKQARVRETGICPIRHKLYSQVFDEIIRQVTINSIESGLLLVRIRNEINQTVKEYENLFASSTSCGIRKALVAETKKVDMESKIESTLARIEKKKCCMEKLRKIYSGIDRKNILRFESIKEKHARQVAALRDNNRELKAKLEAIILPKKGGLVVKD